MKRSHLSLCHKAFIPLESVITGLAFLLLDFYRKLSLRKIELIQNNVKITYLCYCKFSGMRQQL